MWPWQILMGHGRCAKIWPQLRLTKAWSRRAEARGARGTLDSNVTHAQCNHQTVLG